VNYRGTFLRKVKTIRERAVPEWQCCMVYNTATRKLTQLNLHAWLVFELCSNRRFAAVEQHYLTAMTSRTSRTLARRQLDEALQQLLREGVIEVIADAKSA
jgi:transcription initiation factor TFIID subunit TAF12